MRFDTVGSVRGCRVGREVIQVLRRLPTQVWLVAAVHSGWVLPYCCKELYFYVRLPDQYPSSVEGRHPVAGEDPHLASTPSATTGETLLLTCIRSPILTLRLDTCIVAARVADLMTIALF